MHVDDSSIQQKFARALEAERLLELAQESVDRRWRTYEGMASQGPHEFPPDARKDG